MSVTGRLESQAAKALVRAGFSGNGSLLVVGISGGPDSSTLLHCLSRLSERHGLALHAAHLNHDFRGEEAEEDARFAAALASSLGVAATVEQKDVAEYQRRRRISSFEQAARELRYSFLAQVAEETGASGVAVGHTSDDLAETVLLHILRGSGIQGLRGMSESSPWPFPGNNGNLRLFRPLLKVTRADTEGYCRELGQEYREDTGNLLHRFTRNRVRRNLMPLLASEYNPKVRESLVRLSRTAGLELDYMAAEIERVWPQAAREEKDAVSFDRAELAGLHPALQKLLFRRAYACLTGDFRRLGERHLAAMAELTQSAKTGRSVDLPNGLRFQRSYEFLRLSRLSDAAACPFPELQGAYSLSIPAVAAGEAVHQAGPWRVTLRWEHSLSQRVDSRSGDAAAATGPSSWTAYFDPNALEQPLEVRTRQPGDRIQPLGMSGEKKLQDFFSDARVPREWRDRVPLLVAGRGIAWVVGFRIAEWAKVKTEGTGPAAVEVRFEAGA